LATISSGVLIALPPSAAPAPTEGPAAFGSGVPPFAFGNQRHQRWNRKRKLLLNHANNAVERFRQRVTLLFTTWLSVWSRHSCWNTWAAGLKSSPAQLNQVGQRKRLGAHRRISAPAVTTAFTAKRSEVVRFIDWLYPPAFLSTQPIGREISR